MVESEAKELSEDIMLGAVQFGFDQFQPVIQAIIELAEQAARDPWPLAEVAPEALEVDRALKAQFGTALTEAYAETSKQARTEKIAAVKDQAKAALGGEDGSRIELVASRFKDLEKDIVRGAILKTGKRIDGRDTKTVRPITSEVGILPRAHGSALFTRGETQALVVATLGTGEDEQIIDALEGEYREHFMLHYNFPPYSTGEVGRMGVAGSPGNRPW